MKKALLLFILILAMSLTMVACAKDGGDDTSNGNINDNVNDNTNDDTVPEPVKYTITWYDEAGVKLADAQVEEGKTPSYSYTKQDTAEWDYTVEGWSTTQGGEVISSVPSATADADYYAVVTNVKQKYTVVFDTQGGSEIDSVTVEYGTVIAAPEAVPTLDSHKFMGWSSEKENYVEIDWTVAVTEGKTYYAIWNEVVDVKALLEELLDGYSLNPYKYIPEAMLYNYSANLVKDSDVVSDYSTPVDVSDITYGGFGEQWHMILDNLAQSMTFFNVLSAVESVSATSLATFNNYIDKNPADTAHHNFESGIYSITLDFDGSTIYYVLDYTGNIPLFGEQTVQIALSMDTETKNKTVRIQAGDANALTYTITENSYEFAIRYLGVRRAYFCVSEDEDGNVSGSIYEYIVVSDVEIASAANFYVEGDYAYAIGNKADAFIGFTGYISEVYDVESGKLLGYEVQETLSKITYNTLWFNIADIDGINSVKYVEKTDSTPAKFYINGSSSAWEAKTVGVLGGLKAASRRFDIEFRTQYFYKYDAANDKYIEIKVEVPMFFVQEEYYDDLIDDVESTNDITIAVALDEEHITEIENAYDELIPVFIGNKDAYTVELILAFIGQKVMFDD